MTLRTNIAAGSITAVIAYFCVGLRSASGATCESLSTLSLPHTTIVSASLQAAGRFTPPNAQPAAPASPALDNLVPFCRITASLHPTSDSDIGIEVWLPASGWNGKLQSVGNGAWAGVIGYPALGAALSGGYAAAATDTGHVGNTAKFVRGHPEKMADYGYRAVHEMTIAAKAIVAAFYGNGPRLSYWNGCSTGGRQGLMEALRYPADYDGIIAGAPVNFRTHQLTWELWVAQAVHRDEASYIPSAKYPAIHKAALEACDARDGLKDGLIDNPTTCRFDPKVLQCANGDGPTCLTPAQVEAARRIYSPAVDPKTKQEIFPALQPGSELGWGGLAGPQPVGEAVEFFQYVVYDDPAWNFQKLSWDTAAADADRVAASALNVTDPMLKPFLDRGGKLLMYHGWNDQLVAPQNAVNYYSAIVSAVGRAAATKSVRLFMMPGMNHCQGGDGPSTFDRMKAIEKWVEHGQAPDRIVASHATGGVVDRTRPLCPYPEVGRYFQVAAASTTRRTSCAGGPELSRFRRFRSRPRFSAGARFRACHPRRAPESSTHSSFRPNIRRGVEEFIQQVTAAYGDNLLSIVAFGSAVTGECWGVWGCGSGDARSISEDSRQWKIQPCRRGRGQSRRR